MSQGQRDKHTHRSPYPTTPPAPMSALLPSSKLPLRSRAVTPNSAASRPQWISRVAGRVTSAARTASGVRTIQNSSTDSFPTRPYQSNSSTPTLAASMDRPLSPRLTAQSSNMQTPPTNDSFLIDASDDPIRMSSPSGIKRDWPTLTPTPAPAIMQTNPMPTEIFEKGVDSPKSKAPVTPASIVVAAAELTKVITGSPEQKSSSGLHRSLSSKSSYESANEGSFVDSRTCAVSRRTTHKYSTPDATKSATPLPKRVSSFRGRIPNDTLIPKPAASTRKSLTFGDFAADAVASLTVGDSRLHSPSPQSFSRPRPGSVSLKTRPGSINAVQTASSLPLTESQKPTIVEVKPRNSQSSAKSTQQPPTFGSRRLDFRTADILDNGIKRRQVQRSLRNVSDSRPALARAPTDTSDAPTLDTPSASVGRASGVCNCTDSDGFTAMKSDEDMTFAPSSSEDESEIMTPIDRPVRYSKRFERTAEALNSATRSEFHDAFDDESNSFYSHPPPTSPFTALLPTILSEAALPVRQPQDEGKITQALSHLEGKGSPPKHDVDERTLYRMFGHMAKTFEAKNTTMNSSAFLEDAATAKRFLALAEEDEREPKLLQPGKGRSLSSPAAHEEAQPADPYGLEPAASKWSDTTPSEKEDKENSEDTTKATDISSSQQPAKEPAPSPAPEAHAISHESIGYPSRVAATPQTLTSPSQNAVAEVPNISRRQSSPTLGPKPGSVRRARESMKPAPAYARPTQAAEARKNSRLPTASANSTHNQRGRQNTASTPLRRESEACPKTPRVRSKSRYVMDKLGGLFSGKRDKKSIALPPVPRIPEAVTPPSTSMASAELDGTPMHQRASRVPPLPRVPTQTQLAAGMQNQASTATLQTGETTLVDAPTATAATTPRNDRNAGILTSVERLIAGAQGERNMRRKQRLLEYAQALNDGLIYAREAQISAEIAESAARRAELANEITQKTLEVAQKLALHVGGARTINI